jgi:hypothetical protein
VAKIKHTRNENFTHQNKTTLFWRKKVKINLHQNFTIYGITGCDTTSSFFGIGKKSMLKALKETHDQFSVTAIASCAFIQIFCKEVLNTCCLNVASQGGSLIKLESLHVERFRRQRLLILFKF